MIEDDDSAVDVKTIDLSTVSTNIIFQFVENKTLPNW